MHMLRGSRLLALDNEKAWMPSIAFSAVTNLLREFVLQKLTPKVPVASWPKPGAPSASGSGPVQVTGSSILADQGKRTAPSQT
jgi:hypothetical protein